jgi:two-component system sensor histidine kinase KdpD
VAVSTEPGTDTLLRRAARIALRVKGELDVVHVSVSDATLPEDARLVDRLRQLTADLGASWHQIQDDDPAEAIVSFAREQQITQIVTGSIQSSWWHIPGGGPILRRVIHEAGASGIDVHLIARREPPPGAARSSNAVKES